MAAQQQRRLEAPDVSILRLAQKAEADGITLADVEKIVVPAVARLADLLEGSLLELHPEHADDPTKRRTYCITHSGRRALNSWESRPNNRGNQTVKVKTDQDGEGERGQTPAHAQGRGSDRRKKPAK